MLCVTDAMREHEIDVMCLTELNGQVDEPRESESDVACLGPSFSFSLESLFG
jgi:hypothetical protein